MWDGKAEIQQVPTECPTMINETVCVQADVTITPNVEVGTIDTFCVGPPVIGACNGEVVQESTFSVSQNICVQIPFNFSVEAVATPSGMVCGSPSPGGCTE